MHTRTLVLAALITVTLAVTALAAPAAPARPAAKQPHIEVCFVLDTTGSMSGLIAGAKAKIWSIANQLVAAKPTPKLKVALLAYRDRGDAYVTKVFDLSEDIDAVYANLQTFEAAGGGDTPESVNQALREAVTRISWSPDPEVYKAIFLVGDCPPHMDYPDDTPYAETCKAAVKKGIIINTVQAGAHAETTPIWKEIASLAEGSYVAIPQSGGVQVIATPFDEEISRLNAEVGKTIVPYGDEKDRGAVRTKQAMAEAAPAPAAADRLAFNVATGKVVQGGGDLVDAVGAGYIKVNELKEEQLPAEMQGMTPAQREAYVKQQAARRAAVQKQIGELLAKRRAYIEAEQKKGGPRDGFDDQVEAVIRAQAAKKGISYPAR
ncbi:MAG TPA: vWA domain-containing protein [Thermoanaerobaculaceae bacterium]|nr:vWA domain-containing protein [Thermoanaerobaculaceae bacterium]HRS15140.1 vWA domain-containing protein [Thermoanaerobaculaceae bacterium]